mmetsp:Transcript_28797/g.65223  ORF Transcript_28797/g.65223 Transcript_28797/m.65223 type:complete len:259 (-) Transcript_28797:667-1443(-)
MRPLVAESNFDFTPDIPRAGTSYWMETWPSFVTDPISTIVPLRSLSMLMHAPEYSSGMSMSTNSNGSIRSPSMFFSITVGGPTMSSNPSRRIVSISTVKWSKPRPETKTVSPSSVSSTRIATLTSSSFARRSRMLRPVSSFAPDLPAKGDLLTPIVIAMVGCSTSMGSSGWGSSMDTSVSPMLKSGMPEKTTISPAEASAIEARPAASKLKSSPTLTCFTFSPGPALIPMGVPFVRVPLLMRPMPRRPMNGSSPMLEI